MCIESMYMDGVARKRNWDWAWYAVRRPWNCKTKKMPTRSLANHHLRSLSNKPDRRDPVSGQDSETRAD